jgi:hypothetical protein
VLITSGNGGTGSGTVAYTVAPNASSLARSLTISVMGQTFTINQSGMPCNISLNPTSSSPVAAGQTGSFAVTIPAGCAWTASTISGWITVTAGSGAGNGTVNYTVAANATGIPRSGTIQVVAQGGAGVHTITQAGAGAGNSGSPLRFVAVTPCRVMDTRSGSAPFGAPALSANSTRTVPMPASGCGLPATAKAYAVNVTVVPSGPLGYLSIWPSGQPRPLVSTLNSFEGKVVANNAIVPAGTAGSLDVYVTDRTDVILDVNGYFTDDSAVSNLVFYPVTPCRVADTRAGQGASGAFGPPSLAGDVTRTLPVPSGRCGIPSRAQAYSVNFTVVPHVPLGYLTAWPSGSARPLVSTLNSFEGRVVANGAIIRAGAGGAIDVFVTDATDVIVDVNGYFAPDDGAGLFLYPMTPCRLADTRPGEGTSGDFGPPAINGGASRNLPAPAGRCSVPSTARGYTMNVTTLPMGTLGFLTSWPTGVAQPFVSLLNSFDGRVTANGAIVPAPNNGAISVFVTNTAHVIADLNGYFGR